MFKESGPYVAFGFNSINHKVTRLGGYRAYEEARESAKTSNFHLWGVAKVTHPQTIWFLKGGEFVTVDPELTLEIITLLGV